jgi:predicted P-loop ATPase
MTRSVQDYLDSLVWDGTPRLDRWLIDFAGAEDTPHVRATSRAMLVAAVRRARHPGCPYDQMPVIEGPQGSGKTQALRLLAVEDEWFTDTLPITSDDVRRILEATAGKWIIEASELRTLLEGEDDEDKDRAVAPRRKPATLKSFLSRSHDEARLAYQREKTRVPRGFVVIGTSGSLDYLKDSTGNRRFWPVTVRNFDLARLAEVRDQLWAEAAVAEAGGESIQLEQAIHQVRGVHQDV